METMAELQAAGRARTLGCRTLALKRCGRRCKLYASKPTSLATTCSTGRLNEEDIPFCEQHGIGLLAHSPLAKGLLTGKYSPEHRFPDDDERAQMARFQGDTFARYLAVAKGLEAVAHDKGLSLMQLAVAWLLRLPAVTCVLVGAKSPIQVEEHLGAVGVRFSDDELRHIEDLLMAVN